MHQNAQICKLNFKNFLGAMPPDPILGRGYGAPPQTPTPSALRRLQPLHCPPIRNPGSTSGRNHPLKILATPMRANNLP